VNDLVRSLGDKVNAINNVSASRQRAIVLAAGSLLAASLSVLLISVFRAHYLNYVATQNARYEFAAQRSIEAINDFAENTNAVSVLLVNPTGGTMNVYVGTVGATQEVQPGVEIAARPQPVDVVQPHGSDVILVRDWAAKYVISSTSYIFLSAVNGYPERLAYSAYSNNSGRPETVYYAAHNAADFNFQAQTSSLWDGGVTPGSAVASEQTNAIREFTLSHHVKPDNFPTDVGSYLHTFTRRLFR
jgi:hypothetical protein